MAYDFGLPIMKLIAVITSPLAASKFYLAVAGSNPMDNSAYIFAF
jgi:hypothetical protein